MLPSAVLISIRLVPRGRTSNAVYRGEFFGLSRHIHFSSFFFCVQASKTLVRDAVNILRIWRLVSGRGCGVAVCFLPHFQTHRETGPRLTVPSSGLPHAFFAAAPGKPSMDSSNTWASLCSRRGGRIPAHWRGPGGFVRRGATCSKLEQGSSPGPRPSNAWLARTARSCAG